MKEQTWEKDLWEANNSIREIAIYTLEQLEEVTNSNWNNEDWYNREDELTEFLVELIKRKY